MNTSLTVDSYGLATIGRRTQEVAALLPAEVARLHGPCDEAVAGLPGWRTRAALERCTHAWESCLRKLAAEVDANGLNLAHSAANYSDTNQAVHAALVRQAGAGR